MRKLFTGALTFAVLSFFPASVWAIHIETYGAPGFGMNDAVGAVPGVSVGTLFVNDNFTITDLELTISMQHTWVGDIQIELISPFGTTVDIVNRNGWINAGLGDASNYGTTIGGFPVGPASYTFSDAAVNDLWVAACDTAAADGIAAGTYRSSSAYNNAPETCAFTGDPTPSTADYTQLSAFDGESVNGNWSLRVTDYVQSEVGSVGSWSMDITTASHCPDPTDPSCPPPGPGPGPGPGIPVPGTTLLLLAGLAVLRGSLRARA
jgi:subtilisin-like proprotein convertase family protein